MAADVADQADREYGERLDGWTERLEDHGWLRLGQGSAIDLVYDHELADAKRWRWRVGTTHLSAGGEADTARDAVAAVMHTVLGGDL